MQLVLLLAVLVVQAVAVLAVRQHKQVLLEQ
jgi:hypothetical protein